MLAALRSLRGEAGEAAAAYVDRVGYRPVNGEDIGEPCVIELPELVVAAIRSARVGGVAADDDHEPKRTADMRDAVPRSTAPRSTSCSRRRELTYRLRDERGTYADLWAIGIMRRAILAAGRGWRRRA